MSEGGEPHEVIDLTNIDSDSESDDEPYYREVAPLDETAHTQLHMVVSSLDQALLRQTIADLIDEDPYIARALYERFSADSESSGSEGGAVAPAADEGEEDEPASVAAGEDGAEPPPASSSEPVLVPTVETCINCDENFDAGTDRVDGECTFHPGHLQADEAKFVDWDEGPHGPMDTEENRREYPENFTWTCCEGDGVSDGCREGQHETGGTNRKRARLNA